MNSIYFKYETLVVLYEILKTFSKCKMNKDIHLCGDIIFNLRYTKYLTLNKLIERVNPKQYFFFSFIIKHCLSTFVFFNVFLCRKQIHIPMFLREAITWFFKCILCLSLLYYNLSLNFIYLQAFLFYIILVLFLLFIICKSLTYSLIYLF